jgi:biopolymer transport protein ExbD
MAAIMGGGGRGKKGGKKPRQGIHMDMTPMVDVAFLLLTFFMLSTTLTTPQVMEISLPPDSKAKVEIAENNVMTLRVKEDAIFWNIANEAPQKIQPTAMKSILKNKLKENPKLATLIKIDRGAKYQRLVDLIDELNATQIELGQTEKRFSILTMDATDHQLVAAL